MSKNGIWRRCTSTSKSGILLILLLSILIRNYPWIMSRSLKYSMRARTGWGRTPGGNGLVSSLCALSSTYKRWSLPMTRASHCSKKSPGLDPLDFSSTPVRWRLLHGRLFSKSPVLFFNAMVYVQCFAWPPLAGCTVSSTVLFLSSAEDSHSHTLCR